MSDVTPALTPEQWDARFVESQNGHVRAGIDWGNVLAVSTSSDSGYVVDDRTQHAIAALCLHGQPFGFTWEDVGRLRASADVAIRTAESVVASLNSGTQAHIVIEQAILASKRYRSLADRIAALLPPRQP